jgi:DNA polymerase-3 subunit delta
MKLNITQLEQQIGKQIAPLYLISGDDPILKQDAVQLIRKAARQAGFSERVRLSAESGLDEEQLYTTLYSPSLSADKTLVELDFRGKLPGKSVTAIVEDYLAKPSADILVLIDANKLEDTAVRSSWYKTVEKLGTVVTIWPVAREQLPQWIMQRGKKYKLTIQHDAASLLADYVEGNLTAATQAVEKIYLLKQDKPINAELIQSILADESRFTIFDLTESMISDNQARTLHILETLELDGLEPVIVLWGITRELRQLADMASQQQQGTPWDEIFRKHRVFPRRQNGVRRFLGRFSQQKCRECLAHAASIDSILKGGSPGNGWEALQLLCLRLV